MLVHGGIVVWNTIVLTVVGMLVADALHNAMLLLMHVLPRPGG